MLHALSDRHGFRVAQLRSFGRPLDGADWDRLVAARERALAGRSQKIRLRWSPRRVRRLMDSQGMSVLRQRRAILTQEEG